MASKTGETVARAAIEALLERLHKQVPYRQRRRAKKELAAQIGRAPTYLEQLRRKGHRGGKVTMAEWIELTLAVGMDPVDALANIMRRPGDRGILPLRPSGEPPAAVQEAVRRFRSAAISSSSSNTEELTTLKQLDRLRYENPSRAIQKAENAVETISESLIPQLLGVLGSSYRMELSYLDDAEHAIRAGLDLTKNDLEIRGDLLQRLGYVLGERGQFHSSLRIARSALSVHADNGNLARVGQCLVDTGVFRFHLEDYEGAIQAQKSALAWLSSEDPANLFAAYQGLGLYHQRLGVPEQAKIFAEEAQQFVNGLGSSAEIWLAWLSASIARDLQDFEAAENRYRQVLDHFETRNSPPDVALVTLDLVRMFLETNRRNEAKRLARSMLPLCRATDNPHIRRVIMELNRYGGEGISVERVLGARSEMRRRQTRPRPG